MIFYRDRGDDFITKIIPLGTPMDDLYEELMAMTANGGGDEPESVNQALHEGLKKMQWDSTPSTYRAMFLVGDCPPHMDYQDDVKYPTSCLEAKQRNIIINTILMGNNSEAKRIWKEIADKTGGVFIQTDMRVNNISVSAPQDTKINELQYQLDTTRIYYGKGKEQQLKKQVQSEKMKSADAAVNARRAKYSISAAGKSSYYGSQELINDVANGKKVSEIPVDQLPDNMKKMSVSEREAYVNGMLDKRKSLEKQISELTKERQEYIDAEVEKMNQEVVESSFDDVIFNAVKVQASEKNIEIKGKANR